MALKLEDSLVGYVVGKVADGRETSSGSYWHLPRHPISAIATKGKRWCDRRAAFSRGVVELIDPPSRYRVL